MDATFQLCYIIKDLLKVRTGVWFCFFCSNIIMKPPPPPPHPMHKCADVRILKIKTKFQTVLLLSSWVTKKRMDLVDHMPNFSLYMFDMTKYAKDFASKNERHLWCGLAHISIMSPFYNGCLLRYIYIYIYQVCTDVCVCESIQERLLNWFGHCIQ